MSIKNRTFKGGVHAPENKDFTKGKTIEIANVPKTVYIPLSQHVGAPCEPIVNVGDSVKIGQRIGESKAFVSASIHASVAGVVKDIKTMYTPTGMKVKTIIIENDGTEEVHESVKPSPGIENLLPADIIKIINDCGITGMGGAGFPVHVKVSPPPNKAIDTVILNGAECEPYLTGDHRVMLETPALVVYGLKALAKALNVQNAIIGIENNKMDAIKALRDVIKPEDNIQVVELVTKYPQGDEKRVISAITGRIVPAGGLPMDVGCVVSNVSTAKAIAEAILLGKPLYERVVTVTGNGIQEPRNLLVRIGTTFGEVIGQCGGFKGKPGKVLLGGPMMGIAQFTLDAPIIKGANGILVMTEEEVKVDSVQPCIKCGRCIEACPSRLQPLFISAYALKDDPEMADQYAALSCVECGACSFICPSKRPLAESIKHIKKEIMAKRKRS